MKICDICGAKQLRTTLVNNQTGQVYDLCKTCTDDFEAFIEKQKEAKEKTEPVKQVKRSKEGKHGR